MSHPMNRKLITKMALGSLGLNLGLNLVLIPVAGAAEATAPTPQPSPSVAPATPPAKSSNGVLPSEKEQKFFLTLTEAIDFAEKNNHDILLAQHKIEDARLQITETGSTGLPQLSATASYGRQDPILTQTSTDVSSGGGNSLASNPQFAAFLGTASVNSFQSNVTLNQTLFAGFRIVDGVRLAQINIEAVQQAMRQTRQNVAFQVSNAYFNALRAWQVVELDKDTLSKAEEQVRVAQARLNTGTGVKLDVLQAQSQVIQIQQRLSQDLNSYEKAKLSLNQLMGRETDHPIELNHYATVANLDLDESKSLETALDTRSDLKQLKLQKEMSELNATIQARAVWPTISAQVRYTLSDQAVVNGNNRSVQNVNYGLNMNWPIFDGLAAQSKAQRAQESASQAQITLDQLQQKVILQVRQAFMDLDEVKERETMAEAGVKVAEENLRIAKITYKEGMGIMLDVLNAQLTLQQAKNALINAHFDMNIRKASLYQVLGLDIIDHLQ